MAGELTGADTPKLRVTWIRSGIGHNPATRGTVRALGLHRLHETVEVSDTAANRGMIRRVAFLLDVEKPNPGPATADGKHEAAAETAAEDTAQ